MKIALLGAGGQLGSAIAAALETAGGHDVVPVPRRRLDLEDPTAIAGAMRDIAPDAIINTAGYHNVDEAEGRPGLAHRVNVLSVAELAAAAERAGARLLHVSTDYVFGGGPARHEPIGEDAPAAPLNIYGTSKALGDALAREIHPEGCILRVASLFGAGAPGRPAANFVETTLRLAREKGALRVVGDQEMSPTCTADVSRAVAALVAESIPGGNYHAVNSGSVTWHGFACRIVELAGLDVPVEPISSAEFAAPARRPAYSVLGNSRLAAIMGPMPTWEDALARYLSEAGHA